MRRTWLIFSQAVTVAVAVLFVIGTFKPMWLGGAPDVLGMGRAPVSASGVVTVGVSSPGASIGLQPLTAAAKRAAPAVVSVTASKAPPRRSAQPHGQDPWFRFFFGQPGQQAEPQVGLGSGVIVSADGYLLTNHHVVEGADQIRVRLADGREADAQLIGTDPESDIAVLKIALDNLPSVTLGAIEQVQVGDAVLAIGNPFNVGQTVTSGIVSALGRSGLGLSTFENFIQTDAAINPGNSGGALVDATGSLVGINSAIYSQSGGSMGIGFAIPIDLARHVMDGLVRDGQVTRGWIGVQPRDLDPEFAQSFNLPVSQGVLITGVLQNGPASQAGMRPGDVVTTIAGRPVRSTSELLLAVSELKPQAQAQIGVQRGKETLQLTVTVAQRPKVPQ